MTNETTMQPDGLLTPEKLGSYLDVPCATLADWRTKGDGPKFLRLSGRCVRYAWADVMRWLEGCRFSHTTEADGAL